MDLFFGKIVFDGSGLKDDFTDPEKGIMVKKLGEVIQKYRIKLSINLTRYTKTLT